MVGRQIGRDSGGIMNTSPAFCPEDSTINWQYYNNWLEVGFFLFFMRNFLTLFKIFTKQWSEDSNMEVTCYAKNDEVSPDEPCASGPACNGCNVWSEVNGVKYCCANNCDYGYVEVSYENGNVVCHCHH